MQQTNLTSHFLIAMPSLKDPNFEKSVTYICAHNEEGAMGIVINKPLDIDLGEIFEQMDILTENQETKNRTIFHGGPVHTDRGFILHQTNKEWDSSIIVSDELCVAGWAEGQLEQEIMENAWLSAPANSEIIFKTPFGQCWNTAVDHMGIDIEKLSLDIGHA